MQWLNKLRCVVHGHDFIQFPSGVEVLTVKLYDHLFTAKGCKRCHELVISEVKNDGHKS